MPDDDSLTEDEQRMVEALESSVEKVLDQVRNDRYAFWFIIFLIILFLGLFRS